MRQSNPLSVIRAHQVRSQKFGPVTHSNYASWDGILLRIERLCVKYILPKKKIDQPRAELKKLYDDAGVRVYSDFR
jgi:hypothetical protein